ncbi:FAD-dependent oxidoreductase [Ruficoccus sp. ZRK36]|uniref:FAD-dependent oxidoreductase n=1 Tax=Ruficoccus sp. ZRK36 TaxID=2866311 RepID=UPI001C72B164|nr:FAD-dependent oxidoreductase [Ruficoccus sp. ZRK36]QYY36651.1 FAD-dependent oxidoreductase [Ruficoccus sp. ZRK36]
MQTDVIREPARDLPVTGEYDLCVLGGSCTGVFAAIRAARLGLSVALVERMGTLGGVATLSLVNIWHSDLDEAFEKRIFAGLSTELMERLKKRDAVTERPRDAGIAWTFNSAEMQIELDEVIAEAGVHPWLHTAFCAPHVEDGRLTAVIVENKSGRCALRARFFIDATGDGDLCHRLGLPTYTSARFQPSTTCALLEGWNREWGNVIGRHAAEYGLPEGFVWSAPVPGTQLGMLAGTRVFENCSEAEGLTRAEIEGRRQIRAIQALVHEKVPGSRMGLVGLPARIGIRETRHVRCLHQLSGEEVLHGRSFQDAIANGSYRVDIHHTDKPGITFRYLNGTEVYARPGFPSEERRWREPQAVDPTFYQIPYRCLVPQGPYDNLLAAGRFIDADEQAHAAIRVMVNMNQTGEAAGTAAALALRDGISAAAVDPAKLRTALADGGSVML